MTDRTIEFEGRNISVPADASDAEVSQILHGTSTHVAPASDQATFPRTPPAVNMLQNVGGNILKSAVGSLANVGRTVTTPLQMMSPNIKEYMDRSGRIAHDLQKGTGVEGSLASMGVDVAATAGIPVGMLRGAAPIVARTSPTLGKVLGADVTGAAASNAAAGAYLSPDDWSSGAQWGAAGGAVGQQVLSRAAKRLAVPVTTADNTAAEIMKAEGAPLTVGQSVNPDTWGGRLARTVEEGFSAIPLLGRAVRAQREAGRMGWREAPLDTIDKQVAEIAHPGSGPGTGRQPGDMTYRIPGTTMTDLISSTQGKVGAQYDAMLAGRSIRPTAVLQQNMDTIVNDPKLAMTDAQQIGRAHV